MVFIEIEVISSECKNKLSKLSSFAPLTLYIETNPLVVPHIKYFSSSDIAITIIGFPYWENRHLEIACSLGSVGIELNSILPSQNPPLMIYLDFP